MPDFKPESLDWLDDLSALEAEQQKNPSAKTGKLADALDNHKSMISFLLAIQACFDPAAIEKIRLADKNASKFTLSFNSARALSRLKRKVKVEDLSSLVHAALDVTLFRRLKTKQIEALVGWVASGKPAAEFDPSAKPPKTTEEITEPDPFETEAAENTQRVKPKKPKNETLGQRIGSGIDQFFAHVGDGSSQTGTSPTANAFGDRSTPRGSQHAKKKIKPVVSPSANKALGQPNRVVRLVASQQVNWFKKLGKKFVKIAWKELFKIEHRACRKAAHAIVPLHSASHSSRRHHKSGSFRQGFIALFLTPLHWVVYGLLQYGLLWMVAIVFVCPFVPWLRPLLEWPFRFAAHLAIYDFPSWVWAGVQSHSAPTLIIVGLLAIGLYFACRAEPLRMTLLGAALAYLIIHGRGWAYQPFPLSQTPTSETPVVSVPTAVPQAVRSAELGSSKLKSKTSNSSLRTTNSPSVVTYQPAISFIPTAFDHKILELEIASLPDKVVVKDHPLAPDEAMPGDVALSRMQDVADPDKYTMMIGLSLIHI